MRAGGTDGAGQDLSRAIPSASQTAVSATAKKERTG